MGDGAAGGAATGAGRSGLGDGLVTTLEGDGRGTPAGDGLWAVGGGTTPAGAVMVGAEAVSTGDAPGEGALCAGAIAGEAAGAVD